MEHENIVLLIEAQPGVCFQVYNTRNGKVEYSLHKGSKQFLLKTDSEIFVLDKLKTLELLKQMELLIKKSNFRASRIAVED